MNTNKARVQDITAKTQSDVLLDSLKPVNIFESKPTYREQPSTPRTRPGAGRGQVVVSSDMTAINNQIASQGMIINELKSRLEQNAIKTQSLISQLDEIKRDREIGMVQRGRRPIHRVRSHPAHQSDLLK